MQHVVCILWRITSMSDPTVYGRDMQQQGGTFKLGTSIWTPKSHVKLINT